MQAAWVPFREQWATLSDDHECRLWTTDGRLAWRFLTNGGSATAMLVDNEHKLLLAAFADLKMRVFDLEDPMPKGRCKTTLRHCLQLTACHSSAVTAHQNAFLAYRLYAWDPYVIQGLISCR